MDNLLIACADVGSIGSGNFGWADSDGSSGNRPSGLAACLAKVLASGRPVALGFECPLYIPLPTSELDLGKGRSGEGSRPWSAGAGCGALATGLVQMTWTLGEIRRLSPQTVRPCLDWESFETQRSNLLIWEAFVSGISKGADHVDDARIAVKAFTLKLPTPQTDIEVSNSISLAGVALLRAGWEVGVEVLSQQCLAIKA